MSSSTDFQQVYNRYQDAKANRQRYKPLWDRISPLVGIDVQPNYMWNNGQQSKSTQLDQFIDDPTSALSVNQAGDYLMGIMWGTGERAFKLVPSRYVKEIDAQADQTMGDYYTFATEQALYHINHAEAGFNNAMRSYAYDQFAFGTSGIGAFPNEDFKNGVSHNALIFGNFGVDNMAIDEGKGSVVDTVFAVYNWRVAQIVAYFCTKNGGEDPKVLSTLPNDIQEAYAKGDWNRYFTLVFGVFPRANYNPKMKGKRGTRYRGVWFMESDNQSHFFKEEDYKTKPISVCRQIKIRGETWGRSSGTLLLSTISSLNFIVGEVIEVIEKMNEPPLGITSNALFGDSVLDTSSQGLTVFQQSLKGQESIFPLYDVGNPKELIEFLIPYLEGKITTAFKVDILLDFNSAKDMSATESLQRYAIRGRSLSGMLLQQKTEFLIPNTNRSIQILWDVGELGLNPTNNPDGAKVLKKKGKAGRVIPAPILEVISKGLAWYEIQFNNELEKLVRTEAIQNLLQIIQAVGAIQPLYPDIVHSIDWYKMMEDINANLPTGNQIMLSAEKFKQAVMASAQQMQAAQQQDAQLKNAQASSQIQLNQARTQHLNAQTPQATGGF